MGMKQVPPLCDPETVTPDGRAKPEEALDEADGNNKECIESPERAAC